MADNEKQREWQKTNTVMLSARLQKTTDKDILSYLEDKPKQTIIKAALREYIQNHPKQYRVKPEYYDAWYGSAPTSEITGIVALNDITRLAAEWGMPVEELMEQVEEL
jgi:hypothetical protein